MARDQGYLTADAGADFNDAGFGDYFTLLKPRVMALVVFTALVGMLAAPLQPHPMVGLAAILCIAMGGGASGVLNMWWDADIDAVMQRTASRPIPAGKVEPEDAFALGVFLGGFSTILLGLAANWLAASLLAFTILFYVVVYTIWLKRLTPQNIVIGGVAGALPPVIGWVAATGSIALEPLLMFALIFLWTPPHFWALALFVRNDYADAGVPMLTVTHGHKATCAHILGYSAMLAAAALGLAFTSVGGPVYLAVALLLNMRLMQGAFRLLRRTSEQAKQDGYACEKAFFGLSIRYLFWHFGAILAQSALDRVDLSGLGW